MTEMENKVNLSAYKKENSCIRSLRTAQAETIKLFLIESKRTEKGGVAAMEKYYLGLDGGSTYLELKKQKKCGGCKECKKTVGKSGFVPMLAAGLTYGMTPCAPLLLMIGYCFTLSVSLAGVTGVAFSLSSMVSPLLLLVVVTGALSKKMRKEIPNAVKWFRLASYVVLMVMPFLLTSQY